MKHILSNTKKDRYKKIILDVYDFITFLRRYKTAQVSFSKHHLNWKNLQIVIPLNL